MPGALISESGAALATQEGALFDEPMQVFRPVLGAVVLLLAFCGAGLGLYLLYENEGGGQPFFVTFKDARNLEPGSNVIYRDQVVGRVLEVSAQGSLVVVRATMGSAHASLLREHSRFWVQDPLGKSLLCFDNPQEPGAAAAPGHRFTGRETRPEPDRLPPPRPRRLESKPVWLCEVRVSATLADGAEAVRDERKKSAAVVLRQEGDQAWVLAPAWVGEFQGERRSWQAFVEFAGGETCTASLHKGLDDLCILHVAHTAWRGKTAPFWPEPLAAGQGLALANFKGDFFAAELAGARLEGAGLMEGGYCALVDGANVAGFGLPPSGDSGVRWVAVAGRLEALREALR